jgi:hypothetical protein
MIVGSLTILIIKGPSGEAVKKEEPERKGENPINMAKWQTLKARMGGFSPFQILFIA